MRVQDRANQSVNLPDFALNRTVNLSSEVIAAMSLRACNKPSRRGTDLWFKSSNRMAGKGSLGARQNWRV
jgi:hypothetical protein